METFTNLSKRSKVEQNTDDKDSVSVLIREGQKVT